MSLEQKIPDSVIVIPRTHPLSWIMMFYALPKEMIENSAGGQGSRARE